MDSSGFQQIPADLCYEGKRGGGEEESTQAHRTVTILFNFLAKDRSRK